MGAKMNALRWLLCSMMLVILVVSARLLVAHADYPVTKVATPVGLATKVATQTPLAPNESSVSTGAGAACAPMPNAADAGAATQAFTARWTRDEGRNVHGAAVRPRSWGQRVLLSGQEPYRQATDGIRQVWYWEKGRMEMDDAGPGSHARDVTAGLLARELISGEIQVGDAEHQSCVSALIPVAGDREAPLHQTVTYADLRSLASLAGDHRTPQATGPVVARVLPGGSVIAENRFAAYDVQLSGYDALLGHNIAAVFADAIRLETMYRLAGHPLTEPYWVVAQVGGTPRDVLLQVFERRVLTYTPSNQNGWRVEWGNSGRHYVEWRYGRVDETRAFAPTPAPSDGMPLEELAPEAARVALERQGYVGVAVIDLDSGARYSFQGSRRFPMYSTAKVPIMLAVLERARQQGRRLVTWERQHLAAMIQASDNNTTTKLIVAVGGAREVERYLRAIGVDQTRMNGEAWGYSTTTAEDMAQLMAKLGDCAILEPALCAYALELMRGVISDQRWGISAGLDREADIALKNGWCPDGAGWSVNSIGLVQRGGQRYAIAIYTNPSPSKAYGVETIERIAAATHHVLD